MRKLPLAHGIPVRAVDVGGQLAVVSGAQDHSVILWDLETGRRLASRSSASSIPFSWFPWAGREGA